jgi:hypothetical protein
MAKVLGLLAVAATLIAGVAPASAEFFGCNEPRTKVSYSNSAYRSHYAQAQSSQAQSSQAYAQRQRYSSQRRYASQSRTSQWH